MNISSIKELPNNRIATRVATCFLMNGKTELRVYERNLVERYGINEKFILVPLFINYYSKNNFQTPEFFMITRILFLKKSLTCEDIHKRVFAIFFRNNKYFYYIP